MPGLSDCLLSVRKVLEPLEGLGTGGGDQLCKSGKQGAGGTKKA